MTTTQKVARHARRSTDPWVRTPSVTRPACLANLTFGKMRLPPPGSLTQCSSTFQSVATAFETGNQDVSFQLSRVGEMETRHRRRWRNINIDFLTRCLLNYLYRRESLANYHRGGLISNGPFIGHCFFQTSLPCVITTDPSFQGLQNASEALKGFKSKLV